MRGATARRMRSSDRHPCRPDLRFAFAAACVCGSLWLRGLEGEVRQGFRGGMDQGDEPRPLRRCLIAAKSSRAKTKRPPFLHQAVLIRRKTYSLDGLRDAVIPPWPRGTSGVAGAVI